MAGCGFQPEEEAEEQGGLALLAHFARRGSGGILHTSRDVAAAVKWQTLGQLLDPHAARCHRGDGRELKAGGESRIPGAILCRVLALLSRSGAGKPT